MIKAPLTAIGICICGAGLAGVVLCAWVAMTGAAIVEITDA